MTKIMKMAEVKIGKVFTIENTPSYPKFRTKNGYIDMRDGILNESGNCNERECQIMSIEDLCNQFFEGKATMNIWVNSFRKRFKVRE